MENGSKDLESSCFYTRDIDRAYGLQSNIKNVCKRVESVVVIFPSIPCLWFICGNFWLWTIRPTPNPSQLTVAEPSHWCPSTVYVFSLTQIVTCHSVILASTIFIASVHIRGSSCIRPTPV